jgi:hypothetical protein
MNVDRTARNTNMLLWYNKLWLIDHGAALYFHHSWDNWQQQALSPFTHVKDHVLLPWANDLLAVDEKFKVILTDSIIKNIVDLIPDEWLITDSPFATVQEHRQAYTSFITTRIAHASNFINQALHATK